MDFEIKFSDKTVNNVFSLSGGMFRGKTFFAQFIHLLSLCKFRKKFLGPLPTKNLRICQKCFVGVQTKVLEKIELFEKLTFKKNTFVKLLATGVSACQSKVHSTLPEKLFEENNFFDKCKYVKCIRIQAEIFWQDGQNCFLHIQWNVVKKNSLFEKNHLYIIAFTL